MVLSLHRFFLSSSISFSLPLPLPIYPPLFLYPSPSIPCPPLLSHSLCPPSFSIHLPPSPIPLSSHSLSSILPSLVCRSSPSRQLFDHYIEKVNGDGLDDITQSTIAILAQSLNTKYLASLLWSEG